MSEYSTIGTTIMMSEVSRAEILREALVKNSINFPSKDSLWEVLIVNNFQGMM